MPSIFPYPDPAGASAKVAASPLAPAGSPLANFGVKIEGIKPEDIVAEDGTVDKEAFDEVRRLVYTHGVVCFPDAKVSPKQQYLLTQLFDPTAETYGHGNNKTGKQTKSVLHPDLKTLPVQPQVQLIGNGVVDDQSITHGLRNAKLKHPHHKTFHKTKIPDDEDKSHTRFYRWHIDAALYDFAPPKVTSLYALSVPQGADQVCRYDDGTGDELTVPLGTTAFVSGATMFTLLPAPLKSLAVRSRVKYAPHPYTWIAPAHALSTGLGIESEGLEMKKDDLPAFEQEKIQTLPLLWKNEVTGELHFQVHPCGVEEIIVDPLPEGVTPPSDALYPTGAHLTDLSEVRGLLYAMQRPAIAPELVYAHRWNERDFCIFHNRGTLHTVVGAFEETDVRAFWQCNLASGELPKGPAEEDRVKWVSATA